MSYTTRGETIIKPSQGLSRKPFTPTKNITHLEGNLQMQNLDEENSNVMQHSTTAWINRKSFINYKYRDEKELVTK